MRTRTTTLAATIAALGVLSACTDHSNPLAASSDPGPQLAVAGSGYVYASVSLTPASDSIAAGDTLRIRAKFVTKAGKTRYSNPYPWTTTNSGTIQTWASSDSSVASVSNTGLVRGLKAGVATITGTTDMQQSASALIAVLGDGAPTPVDSVDSSPTAPTAPTTSGSGPTADVIGGVRPRGFGQGSYALLAPAGGRALWVAPDGDDADAGSASAPFRTINKAAQVAAAGDVVTIRAGTYNESVTVRNSGTSAARIVFQAESRGSVILTGPGRAFKPYTYYGGVQNTGQLYVTVRGLVFRGYASNVDASSGPSFPAALKLARGWKVEDCWFDNAGNTAIQANASDVEVTRTTIEKSWIHAITAWAPANSSQSTSDSRYQPLENIRLSDLVIRGNYTKATSATASLASYVAKFTTTRGTVIDNVESTANNGPGFWLDARNSEFTIRNSYFHHNRDVPGTTRTGRGLNLEINWGPGLIENNVFAYNAGPGMAVTNTAGVTVRANRFTTNLRSVELVNADRGWTSSGAPLFPTKNLKFFQNEFKDWKDFSGIHTLGGTFTSPASMGIKADSNVYQPVTVSRLAWWQVIGGVSSIAEMRSKYGWEAAGRTGTIQ